MAFCFFTIRMLCFSGKKVDLFIYSVEGAVKFSNDEHLDR